MPESDEELSKTVRTTHYGMVFGLVYLYHFYIPPSIDFERRVPPFLTTSPLKYLIQISPTR